MNRQYPLPLPQHEAMTADNFMITASNREAVAWALERAPSAWSHHCVILYGPPGCGKTHVLTIWTEKTAARKIAAGEDVVGDIVANTVCPPPLGEGLGAGCVKVAPPTSSQAIALDNADQIAGNRALEEWLQHLYNATQVAKIPLLLTAAKPPANWSLRLKDIESRLKSCPAIEMKEPDDELMRGLLLKLFADRQLLVEMEVIDYLLPRLERTGTAVRKTVSLLDEKALENGRKITVPFISDVLK
jgi:chromosomal replication initiation ATPase DnaA